MSKQKAGKECFLCDKRFKKGDQVYLVRGCPRAEGWARFLCFPMCTPCAEKHPNDYEYLSYLIYVGGVGR